MSIGPADVARAVHLAYQVYEFYSRNPQREFADFANDVHNLGQHLNSLQDALINLQADAHSAPPSTRHADLSGTYTTPWQTDSLREVLGDFNATLDRANQLVQVGARRGVTTSTASRTRWALSMEPKVAQVRERIQAHSLKITTIVQSMQMALSMTLERRIDIAVEHIISRLSNPEQNLELGLGIPYWLRTRFDTSFRNAYDIPQHPRDFPMRKGVNGFLYHFDLSTVTFSVDAATQNLAPSADQWINLMKSKYILEKIKRSSEYELKVSQRHDLLWSHFIYELERKCIGQLRRFSDHESELRRLRAPTQDVIEYRADEDFQLWLKDDDISDSIEPGLEIVDAILHLDLRSPNPHEAHELEVNRIDKNHLGMQRVVTPRDASRHKVIEPSSVDLETARLKPIWICKKDRQYLDMTFNNALGREAVLPFMGIEDMWKFQQALTAYRVMHHELLVETNSYHQGTKDEKGQASLQIWRENRIDSEELAALAREFTPTNSPDLTQAAFAQSSSSLPSRPRAASSTSQSAQPPGIPAYAVTNTSTAAGSPRRGSTFSQSTQQSSYRTAHTSLTRQSLAETVIDAPVEPKVILLITITSATHRRDEIFYLSLKIMNGIDPLIRLTSHCGCRKVNQCVHITLSGMRNRLDAQALVATPGESGPLNIAALGAYQNNPVRRPPGLRDVTKLVRIELTFPSPAKKVEFMQKFDKEKQRFVNYKNFYANVMDARLNTNV